MKYDPKCPFCTKPNDEIIVQNHYAKAFYDTKPANPGHVLVVPKEHVRTIFDCSAVQILAIRKLVLKVKHFLDRNFHPGGYQIGMNCYPIGGQSVLHAHVHVIPRYRGQLRRQIFPTDKSNLWSNPATYNNPNVQDDGITVKQAWQKEFKIMESLKNKGEKVTFMSHYINHFR
ncbi:MAG: HIT family protein [Acetilactobacillus jinshanensis]